MPRYQYKKTRGKKRKSTSAHSKKSKKSRLTENEEIHETLNISKAVFDYYSKLCALILYHGLRTKYDFELHIETKSGMNMSDVVFTYKNISENHFTVFQPKVTRKYSEHMSIRESLNNAIADLKLCDRYNHYKIMKKDARIDIKYFLIHLEEDFEATDEQNYEMSSDWNIQNSFGNILEPIDSNVMSIEMDLCRVGKMGKFYKFNNGNLSRLLKRMLIECDYQKLSAELIECFLDRKILSPKIEILKRYSYLLMKDVIDVHTKRFKSDFVNELSEDCEGLDSFRRTLEIGLKKRNVDFFMINDKNDVFNISEQFESTNSQNKGIEKCWLDDSTMKDADVEDFLMNVVILTDQPSELEIGDYIKNQITNENLFEEEIYESLSKNVTNWMNGDSNAFTNNRSILQKSMMNFFTSYVSESNEIIFKGSLAAPETKINQINFDDDLMSNHISKFVDSSSNKVCCISTENIFLSVIKIFKILRSSRCNNTIFVKLEELNESSITLKAFESELINRPLFVVECETEEATEDIEERLLQILNLNENKKIIFISKEDNRFVTNFKNNFQSNVIEHIVDTKLSVGDLVPRSYNMITARKNINFQGRKVDMAKLIDKGIEILNHENILIQIILDDDIKIGRDSSDFGKIESSYISRSFFLMIHLDIDIVIVGGLKECDFYLGLKNVKISQAESCKATQIEIAFFNRICNDFVDRNVFLMRKENDDIITVIKSTYHRSWDYTDLLNKLKVALDGKAMVLLSDLGMGKSWTFSKMCHDYKTHNPLLWVEKVDLNTQCEFLDSFDSESTLNNEDLIEFLHKALNLVSSVDRNMFTAYLKEGKTVLFFDSFDLLLPNCKKIICDLLKKLLNVYNGNTIFINCRPSECAYKDFEEKLGAVYIHLQQFTEKDQAEFLEKYWTNEKQSKYIRENYKIFKNFLINFVKMYTRPDLSTSFSIPKHMSMIVEASESVFEKFSESDLRSDDENRELLRKSLQKLSVPALFENYWVPKLRQRQEFQSLDPSIVDLKISKFQRDFLIVCLNCILEGKIDSVFIKEGTHIIEIFVNEFQVLLTEMGFQTPYYTNRLLAENLSAQYIIDRISEKNIISLFLTEILKKGNESICSSINRLIHIDDEKITPDWKRTVKKVSGKTMLFVVENNWSNIAKILIDNGVDTYYVNENNENIFHMAYKKHVWENFELDLIDWILDNSENESDKDKLRELFLMESFDRKETPLLLAVRKRNFHEVISLFDKLENLEILEQAIDCRNVDNENFLHLAVMNKNDSVLKCTIDYMKNHNFFILKSLLLSRDNRGYVPLLLIALSFDKSKMNVMVDFLIGLQILEDALSFQNNKHQNIMNIVIKEKNEDLLNLIDDLQISPALSKHLLQHVGPDKRSILHSAAIEGNIAIFKWVLNKLNELNILSIQLSNQKNGFNMLKIFLDTKNIEAFEVAMEYLKNDKDLFLSSMKIYDKNDMKVRNIFLDVVRMRQDKLIGIIIKLVNDLSISEELFTNLDDSKSNILSETIAEKNINMLRFLIQSLEPYPDILKKLLLNNELIENSPRHVSLFLTVSINNVVFFETIFRTAQDLGIVEKLILLQDEENNTVLHETAKHLNWKIFKIIFDHLRNDPELLKKLIQMKNSKGEIFIFEAVPKGFSTYIKSVFDVLSSMNMLEFIILSKNEENDSFYHCIIKQNWSNVLAMMKILKNSPELFQNVMEIVNEDRQNILLTAASLGRCKWFYSLFKDLIDRDSFQKVLELADKRNNNIMHYALETLEDNLILKTLNKLIKKKYLFYALIRTVNADGKNFLLTAISVGSFFCFRHILDSLNKLSILGNSILCADNGGKCILHYAVEKTEKNFLDSILNTIASNKALLKRLIEMKNGDGRNYAMHAITLGRYDYVNTILEHQDISEIMSVDNNGDSILSLAVKNNRKPDIFERLGLLLRDRPKLLEETIRNDRLCFDLCDVLIGDYEKFKNAYDLIQRSFRNSRDSTVDVGSCLSP